MVDFTKICGKIKINTKKSDRMALFENRNAYENLTMWIFDGVGEYGIPEIKANSVKPETIIFYGNIPDECMGNIIRVKAFQDKFKEARVNGW